MKKVFCFIAASFIFCAVSFGQDTSRMHHKMPMKSKPMHHSTMQSDSMHMMTNKNNKMMNKKMDRKMQDSVNLRKINGKGREDDPSRERPQK